MKAGGRGMSEKWVARVPVQAHSFICLKRNNSSELHPEWDWSAPRLVYPPQMDSHGKRFARFHAAIPQFSCRRGTVMAHGDCRWAVILLPEPRSASSRTTVCFESNHNLLRVEPRSASSRTTLRKACAACTSAMVMWHEKHRIGLPEDRITGRAGHIAQPPSTMP